MRFAAGRGARPAPAALVLAAIVCLAPAGARSQAPAHADVGAARAPAGSKVWIGHEHEFEVFLATAPIERVERVPVGVTEPLHAFFRPGGLAEGAVLKILPPGKREGYFESYESEIAAYELDKLLALGMVPPTVERKYKREIGSLQFWVPNCKLLKTVDPNQSPDIRAWNRQVHRQRVWDNLVGNIDRNQGNLLVDDAWDLILIDHSRAFTRTLQMPFPMTNIDRDLYGRLKALTRDEVREHLGRLLFDGPAALLKRRDMIVKHFEKLIAQKGEAAVLLP